MHSLDVLDQFDGRKEKHKDAIISSLSDMEPYSDVYLDLQIRVKDDGMVSYVSSPGMGDFTIRKRGQWLLFEKTFWHEDSILDCYAQAIEFIDLVFAAKNKPK